MTVEELLPPQSRITTMQSGIAQLDQWLQDVVRVGLLQYDFSVTSMQEISSRMVDAKLGAIARRLRHLSLLSRSEPNWFDQVLASLADLNLLISAYRKLDDLPVALQHTIFNISGYSIQKSKLAKLKGIIDIWRVMGITFDDEENLKIRRTWITGAKSKRTALLLDFAFGNTPFDFEYKISQFYQGRLVYYPGAIPLRAQLIDPISTKRIEVLPAAFSNVDNFLDVFAKSLSKNPWLSYFPACIQDVTVLYDEEHQHFVVKDGEGTILIINNSKEKIWPLFATLAGSSCVAFGIWDSKKLHILSVVFDDQMFQL